MTHTEIQCGRCGSSLGWEQCEVCPLVGYYDEPNPACSVCHGDGGITFCLSSAEYCAANPLPGREHVKCGAVEEFEVPSR